MHSFPFTTTYVKSPCLHCLSLLHLGTHHKVILGGMTSIERHHYFGDGSDPVFHLARPRLIPTNVTQQVRLTISSGDFHLDSTLATADGLLADHLLEGITVNGHTVSIQLCHFRASNATHVISVNNCDGRGLDGIFVTPDKVISMHPIPSRLSPVIQPLLPCSYFSPAPNGTYGVHILHAAPKRTMGGGRAKREMRRGRGEELCATGPKHDVSTLFRGEDPEESYRRPIRFRDVTELTGDLDLQKIEDTQDAHLEDHNHTVTANPVSAVLRRTVELAVFCDSDLYRNFPLKFDGNRESQVSNYVLTIVNAVQGIYHQQELEGYVVDLSLVEMQILTESNSRNYPSSSGGDIGAYLSSFCAWQQNRNPGDDTNPKHWDHALMLSGLDLHSSGNPSVIGLAWVGGMCRPSHSCTMNEGLDFSSVYVVAHEMGHNFGMNHDGQGDASACSSTSYIMSPSVGPGKTTWSSCSSKVLHSFLSKTSCLDDGKSRTGRVHEETNRVDKKIKYELRGSIVKADRRAHEVKLESLLRLTPGYQFPLTEQCKAMYGRDYHPALTKEDLCKYLYCTNGVVTRPAHPALEGSFCGSHRVCIAGKCRQEEELVSLLAYNIPSPDEPGEQQTEPPGFEEDLSSSPTTSPPVSSTSSLVMGTCIEEPATEGKHCNNDSSTISPCTCVLDATPPDDIANIPKEICPFLAPVFHELFNCSSECPQFDLYLDLATGNFSQALIGPKLLKELSQSCTFDHYNIVMDQDSSKMSGSLPFVSPMNSEICKGLPHFLHPSIGCSYLGNEDQGCIPQNIILKTPDQNINYIHTKEQTDESVMRKLKNYSQRSSNRIYEEFVNNSTSFTIQTEENQFISCNLEATFPKTLRDLPSDVCPFLAPFLHGLFNCSKNACVDYIIVINLKEHNITKVPLTGQSQPHDSCPACSLDAESISSILFKIIKAVLEILSQSTFICKLLPVYLKPWLPNCSSLPLMDSVPEDTCPPVAVVVEIENAAFTYSLNSARRHEGIMHQLQWHGKLYDLENVTSGRDALTLLKDKYSLDTDNQVVRKYDSKELSLNLLDNSLREYVGQKDRFLPLNAPEAMPHTKVGKCSVTCGRGVRIVEQECVDVHTEEVLDNDSCQGYIVPKPAIEQCVLPDCLLPQWKIEEWGACQQCGTGVQFRQVQCTIPILESQAVQDDTGQGVNNINLVASPVLVVEDKQCEGERPPSVQECHKICTEEVAVDSLEIAKDFDY
ncbi:uncharacterized protein LOC123518696 isoform X2 [Portunus trituberculatus]|uniref:uncharacterized protein LOC123518696 isoform X2 n=1 Tax=Portunus trituberculatus TaxID=210409 RepID=UPI001E1CC37C|nr:uncharacterized protein LOC123518696 isoform X2 [Portunus trituberculatus]